MKIKIDNLFVDCKIQVLKDGFKKKIYYISISYC